jgi:hypothetical protein
MDSKPPRTAGLNSHTLTPCNGVADSRLRAGWGNDNRFAVFLNRADQSFQARGVNPIVVRY